MTSDDLNLSPDEIAALDPKLAQCLEDMHRLYSDDPVVAVRGQGFIKTLHSYLAEELRSRLHPDALKQDVRVVEEAKIMGSFKNKDVDVAVVHPQSGPIALIGVRSQMSSVGKNVLTYYQDIAGECVSLQDRNPMAVFGYVYLHPRTYVDKGRMITTDYQRYAKLYASISGRDDVMYRHIRGVYDEFAYMLVDFDKTPIELRDDLVQPCVSLDLSVTTFVDRVVETTKRRNVWLNVFL